MATDEHIAVSSLPVLVRLSSLSIEVYHDPGVNEHDDVIVIDMTPLTGEITQGCIQNATRSEEAALMERGMSAFRAYRNARATGNVVNIYI